MAFVSVVSTLKVMCFIPFSLNQDNALSKIAEIKLSSFFSEKIASIAPIGTLKKLLSQGNFLTMAKPFLP